MTSQRASNRDVTLPTSCKPAASATNTAARTASADATTKRTRCGCRASSAARSVFLRPWRSSVDRFFPSLVLDDRQASGHDPPVAYGVDDIDTIVLPVRPRDTEKEGRPAPEAELSLLRQRAPEEELAPLADEVDPLLLADAVHVHLVGGTDPSRQGHPGTHGHSMPVPVPALLRSASPTP